MEDKKAPGNSGYSITPLTGIESAPGYRKKTAWPPGGHEDAITQSSSGYASVLTLKLRASHAGHHRWARPTI